MKTYEVTSLSERIVRVRERMSAAAERSDRSLDDITLVAVTKTHPVEAVQSGLGVGLTDFGENRVQEAEQKIPSINGAKWHLIGHLQSNKARRAVELFDVIHSVDSVSLAQRLDRMCEELNRKSLPVLIQVDLGHETTKNGVTEEGLRDVVSAVTHCQRLRLTGLMTLPPFFERPEKVRPYFHRLRELRDQLHAEGVFKAERGELSMGMTNDFEVAIEEGATMIRVGTAIFGERQ